ncbi:MAG: Gfo/Idh/MocA family protein [Candidatus Methylomirabilales bacterium]
MRILIAGVGSIGRRHLLNLRQLGMSDIVLYRTRPDRLKEAPDLAVFTDLRDALGVKPDIVIVSNPTAQHLEVALPAAQAGCNLFIEKPLSHSWDGVEEMLSMVRKNNLLTLVGFDLRFDPGLCKVKSILDVGSIGRVVAIQAQVGQYLPDWKPSEDYRKGISAHIKTGGGVIFDLIHELDYVSWLIGPVHAVACFADKVSGLEIETEDTAAILLRFENGAIGTVHLDYIQHIPSRTCRVIGEGGTIFWDYYGKKVSWYDATTAGKRRWEEFEYPGYERNDRFIAEMKHVIACVRGQELPKVDAFAGSQVLKLALAAKESALTGKVSVMS